MEIRSSSLELYGRDRPTLMTEPVKKFVLFVVLALTTIVFVFELPVYAQSQPLAQNIPNAQGQQPSTSTMVNEIRIPSANALGSIFFESRNSLIFSVGAAETFTDNLYYSGLSYLQYSNGSTYTGNYFPITSLTGRVAYQREWQKTTLQIDYGLAYGIITKAGPDNFLSQDGGIYVSHRVTPRFNFNIGSSAFVSPFTNRSYTPVEILPANIPNIVPNNSLIMGYGRAIGSTTNGGFSYDLSRRSSFNTNFYYTLTRYQQVGSYSMNQPGVRAEYSYRLKERTSMQLGYLFSYYSFDNRETLSGGTTSQGSSIYRNHFPYVGLTHQITSGISGSIQVGPNFTIGNPIYYVGGGTGTRPGPYLGVNGTLTFSEAVSHDPRTFYTIGLGQLVSDGSGLGYVTVTRYFGGSVGHLFTRKLLGSINGGYTRSDFPMNLDSNGQALDTSGVSAGAFLRLNMNQKFQVYANYLYFRQLSSGFSGYIPGNGSGNAFTIGINYLHPIFF